MRPDLYLPGEILKAFGYIHRTKAQLQRHVKAGQVDPYGFVRVLAAGVLYGIGVDCQLVDLPKKYGVAEFSAQDFCINFPAFRGGVVIAIVGGGNVYRHGEPASRAETRKMGVHWWFHGDR